MFKRNLIKNKGLYGLTLILFFIFLPLFASAQQDTTKTLTPPGQEITIPGISLSPNIQTVKSAGMDYFYIPWVGEYVGGLYKFGVGVCAVLAVLMIMIGGVIWLTAGGSQERVTTAKTYITGALAGLVIALGSYTVLKIVNPALVNLMPLKIAYVPYEELIITPMAETSEAVATGAKGTPSGLGDCVKGGSGTCGAQGTVKMAWANFPVASGKVLVNEKAVSSIQKVGDKIRAANTGYNLINGGTFCCRPNANNPKKNSLHCYGIALDINPSANPNYKKTNKTVPCKTDIPQAIIDAFKSEGWVWGGEFKTVCDAMHFEWHGY